MNILGENFAPYVNTQVNIRQEKYAAGLSSNKSTEDITFMNSKTAFARLMSSVEVSDVSNYKNINALGLSGLDLAKKYILFAGTSTSALGFQRSGLTSDGAYGVGGFELGYRPMPGINSVEVKTDGNGFTTSAVVKIKAYNRQQLEILDALYLRLGYYMLLEWGNVIYWDNNKKLVNDPYNNSLQDYFFNPSNTSINDVLIKIKEKRETSSGNYDALFGKVINFNWSYAADNTFDITVNLRSIGDIIESLKINSSKTITEDSPETTGTSETTPPPYEYYKNKNSIGKLYYNVVKKIFDRGGEFFREPANSELKGEISFTRIPFQGENAGYKYYIKLSRLLYELQESNIFTYNNNDKALKIDFDSNNNFIPINEITLSVDPNICIVRRTDTVDINPLFSGLKRKLPNITFNYYPNLDEFLYTEVADTLYGRLMNIYVSFDFILEKIDAFTDVKTQRAPLKDTLNEILINISNAIGSANKLECFIEEETSTVKIIDKNPYPLRDELLKSIGIEIPETTKFNVTGYYGATNQTFNNSTSFIKSLNFQTQIPPEFATIISIGAAANKKVVGEDTTAFSRLNRGLTTRFAESITDGQEKITDSSIDETPNALFEAILPLAAWIGLGNATQGRNIQWNLDTFSSNRSILADLIQHINKIKSKEDEKSANSTSSPTSGFIPINVSLTMDGLSGMKIFQKFDLDSSYLPANYPDAVEILIKGISHTIQNNIWDTTIDSVIVGKSSAKSLAASNSNTSTSTDNKAQARGYVEQKITPSNGNCERDQSIIISKNFNLAQLSCSPPKSEYLIPGEGQTKYFKFGKQNLTRQQVINNLKVLAENILEPIKAKYPSMFVTSAYRNKGNGSQHEGGQAADIQFSDIRGKTNQNDLMVTRVKEIQTLLKGKKGYDQLLLEYRAGNNPWIHISFSTTALRNESLTIVDDITRFRNEFKNPYA
jgi:hypothetical protein